MDHRPRYKSQNYKISRGKIQEKNLSNFGIVKDFLDKTQKPKSIKNIDN